MPRPTGDSSASFLAAFDNDELLPFIPFEEMTKEQWTKWVDHCESKQESFKRTPSLANDWDKELGIID
jgi:hypothetical protein